MTESEAPREQTSQQNGQDFHIQTSK